MTPRWPPILGVVGFDFGTKPAVSLVLPRKKAKQKDEWETPITGGEEGPPPCDPAWCALCEITIQATISGSLFHDDDGCGGGAEFSISGVSDTAICAEPTGCVGNCITAATPLVYACAEDCPPEEEHTFTVEVNLVCPDEDGGDWFLTLNIQFYPDRFICGHENLDLGGDGVYELNIGDDPTGTHNISFDDPGESSVHYDVVVTVTGC